LCLVAGSAQGGMTSFSLTEVAAARLDAISFFLVAFALSALLLRWAWNVLARDFAWMPKLGYRQAFAVLVVSGLFVHVALSLIAGARELMTPGAWVRTGATHRLVSPERAPTAWLESGRRVALERLRDELWAYAAAHEGKTPANQADPAIPKAVWAGVHPNGELLAYVPGRKVATGDLLVAYEPDAYGATRFALLSNGEVIRLSAKELAGRVQNEFAMVEGKDGSL
jgi:hypothetical protein